MIQKICYLMLGGDTLLWFEESKIDLFCPTVNSIGTSGTCGWKSGKGMCDGRLNEWLGEHIYCERQRSLSVVD